VVDAFSKLGIQYQHSERDRSAIYLDALPLFTAGKARLLDNKRLVTQFASLERRTSPVGKDRVDHGPSGMDDLCNSAALAMVLAVSGAEVNWAAVPGILAQIGRSRVGPRPAVLYGARGRQVALADMGHIGPCSMSGSRVFPSCYRTLGRVQGYRGT
jgi:hypothetical protein